MSSLNYTFVGADPTSDNTGDYTPLIMPGTADIVNSQLERFDNNPNILEQFRSGVENATGADLQGYNVPVTPFSKIKNYHLSSLNASGMAGNQTMTFVNVLQEYMWTLSPQFARDRTNKYVDPPPGIILKEKFSLVNNLIAQALYSFSSLLDVEGFGITKGIYDELRRNMSVPGADEVTTSNNVSPAGVAEENTNENEPSGSALNAALGVIKNTVSSIPNVFEEISEGYENYINIFKNFSNPDLERVLFPYQRLYIVAPTGFNYKLPYLNTTVLNQRGQFGDQGQNVTKAISDIVGAGTDAAEFLGGTLRLLQQAGSSKIERAKNYNYPTEGEPIEIIFPLYNTHPATYKDICNNFKLMLLLLYQNLPLRQDRIIVEPPVMYDVQIPGNRREPYCFVSSLTINYKGSTRMMHIDTKGISYTNNNVKIPDTLETIIPDAYEIRMVLQPMIAQTKNLLFSTLQDKIIKVGQYISTETSNNTNAVLETDPNDPSSSRTTINSTTRNQTFLNEQVEQYGGGGPFRF